jgi:hypothetical protein
MRPKRFGRRENARSLDKQHSSHRLLRGVPGGESRSRESRTYGGRVHVIRSGGRSRFDASRVFYAGRSQGLVE